MGDPRSDAAFFLAHPHRGWRLRRSYPGEFRPDADLALVVDKGRRILRVTVADPDAMLLDGRDHELAPVVSKHGAVIGGPA